MGGPGGAAFVGLFYCECSKVIGIIFGDDRIGRHPKYVGGQEGTLGI
jgi:hypothetical protein